MRSANSFGRGFKAVVAGIALFGSVMTSSPVHAATSAPDASSMDRTIVGSGSDTTYDLMMALDKVYNAANGCAAIWYSSASQPINGQCDTDDAASGNGVDKSQYPWVNDSHAVIKQVYPVGSGNGQNELCKQDLAASRPVDFARSSSGPTSGATAEKCSDLKYIAYAIDAVSWYHFTKNPDGSDTASAKIASISTAELAKIFKGTTTNWSQLNNNSGVKDKDGNQLTDLPNTGIVRYTTQSASGTFSYFTNSARTNSVNEMKTPAATPVPSQTAAALYTTNQENNPTAIANDGNTNNAIYFMSVGRYRQNAGITGIIADDATGYSGNASGIAGLTDALGAIDGIAPTYPKIQLSEQSPSTGKFPFSRRVYNVTRYASAATNAYVGPDGFLCKATDSTKDRIKNIGYRTLIENAIKAEGFVAIPVSSGSYCRIATANIVATADDASAPTITLASPSPVASTDGTVTVTVNFNEGVRATDASKLTVTQSGNADLTYTTTATSRKGVTVSAFDTANTNDADPYANKLLSTLTINVKNIAYGSPVVVTLASGAVKDRANNSSAEFSTSIASNTSAPDTVAPTVSGVSSIVSAKKVWTLTFSEPVRALDLTKFSYVKNVNAVAPVALASAAPTYTCKNSDAVVVPCSWDANSNANDPNGYLAIKTLVINTGQASTLNVSVNIAAGAFQDRAGNTSAADSEKDSLTAVAATSDFVDSSTSTTNAATKTYHVYGGTNVAVTLAQGTNGGVATVTVDGTLYDTTETVATVGVLKGVNLYAATSGTTTVTIPVTTKGWHTVKITNATSSAVLATAGNLTGLPSKRVLTAAVAAVPAVGTPGKPGYVAAKPAVKATFAQGTTVTVNSVIAGN